MERVSSEIKNYIETEILPKYEKLPGHTGDHIEYVIRRSLKFAEEVPEVNFDMAYIIAAYHDLGRLVDNKTHNLESKKMLLNDSFLKERFSEEEMKIMGEAVEDHRASLKYEPRSIYGKIVSSADRNTEFSQAVKRSFKFNRAEAPDKPLEEVIETTRFHLRRKFGKDGYATTKMFFKDPDYAKYLEEIEEKTKDPEEYLKTAKEVLGL